MGDLLRTSESQDTSNGRTFGAAISFMGRESATPLWVRTHGMRCRIALGELSVFHLHSRSLATRPDALATANTGRVTDFIFSFFVSVATDEMIHGRR